MFSQIGILYIVIINIISESGRSKKEGAQRKQDASVENDRRQLWD